MKAEKKIPAKMGRPSEYTPEVCKELLQYVQKHIDFVKSKPIDELKKYVVDFPSVEQFNIAHGWDVDVQTQWKELYPDYLRAYKKAMDMIKQYFVLAGTSGIYHPIFCMFTAKNMTDMRDNVDVTSKGLSIAPNFALYDNVRRHGVRASKDNKD
jgi:hypothetical protein